MKVKNKHAKRVIRDLKVLGCKINYIRSNRQFWNNKKFYEISISFRSNDIICCGYSELDAFKFARKLIQWEISNGTIARGRLWYSRDFME